MLDELQPELFEQIIANLEPVDLLQLACCCSQFDQTVRATEVWQAKCEQRWPAWSILELVMPAPNAYEEYRMRHQNHPTRLKTNCILLLRGSATDSFDGNNTPCMIALCRPPAHLVPPNSEQNPATLLIGESRYAAGSKHNAPVNRTLIGHEPEYRVVEWREHSGSFGHWIYSGVVSADGRSISGSFHLSCLPRKRGRFTLTSIPSTTENLDGARWWPTTPALLMNRVVVRWAVGSIEKRARQQQLLAGAAAVQAEWEAGQAAAAEDGP